MAICKQTAFELIQDVFSPCVAVLCSSDVEKVCAKNNLSFVEMVQPFCRLSTEVTIRDPSNMPCAIKNFRVMMKDLHSQTPVLSVGKKMMSDAVSSNIQPATDGILMNTISTENYQLKYSSSTPWFEAYREVFFQVTTPTEHEFIHNYLSCIFVVSSSHQDPLSQINELSQQLIQHQQNNLHNNKWFFSFVYTYYLLLHDVSSEDLAKAEAVYQSMKTSFGSTSCHLLQINSVNPSSHNANTEDVNGTIPDPWTQFLPKYCVQNDSSSNSQILEENHYDAPALEEKSGDIMPNSNESNTIDHPLLFNPESAMTYSDPLTNSNDEVDPTSGFTGKFFKNTSKQKRHGVCLTLSDMDRIKCFVQDFCIQGLIPFIEKQIRILSEQVANRKGIHRTLFGVTKKFFGNKPGAQNPASALNSVVYGPDAPELQVRKLGDLAFMFQLYEVAYQAFHNAKRDFNADQAWLHFAGSSEMAALSVFMQNSFLHEYPGHYIESAITTYLHTCKLPELATRATFLSTECLKSKGLYRDAALQFIRMPSDADLASALCLEQAAYCYINCKPPKIRKYAFHIILAGHRFSKAGQKKHALRSYKLAEQVYSTVGWNFAKNHINFTIGRLSLQLDQLESACSAFEPLLVSRCQLPPAEQANYLREYLYVLKRLMGHKSEKTLPILPVPFILSNATKVLLSEDIVFNENVPFIVKGRGFDRGDLNNHVWSKLEEIVTSRLLNLPVFTSQLQCFTNKTSNVAKPNAVVGEILSLEVVLKNPLSISLIIDDVFPLWTFVPEGSESVPISNEPDIKLASVTSAVLTKVLARVTLEPLQEKNIHLLLTPQQVGSLSINGIAYNLLSLKQPEGEQLPDAMNLSAIMSLQGKQCLTMRGPRRNKTAEDRATVIYAEDNRLNINVLTASAKLQVKFQKIPTSLFCGEVQRVTAEFSNVGPHRLKRILMASPTPGIFAVFNPGDTIESRALYKQMPSSRQPSPVIAKWESDWMVEILMPDGEPCVLDPGQSIDIPVWFKGPEIPGDHDLDILFYYESEPTHPKLKYRVLQLSTVLVTYPSVSVHAHAMRSFCSEEKSSNFHPAAIPSSLIISAEVGNISQEFNQVSLVQISCISKSWCFLPSEENNFKGSSVIHPEETLLLTLKAIGFDPKSTVSSQEVKVFSHIPMGRVEIDSSSTPCSDFCQKLGLDLRSILPADSELRNVPTVKECNQLLVESDVILLLVVIWKAKVQKDNVEVIITGQHHIPIHSLAPSTVLVKTPSTDVIEDIPFLPVDSEIEETVPSNVPSELSAITAMVKCSLNFPFNVQHDFSANRVVVVPIELIIRSTCDVELSLIIDNSSHSESSLGQISDENSQVAQRFSWVGGSRREILVKPHTIIPVALQALFCAPGTYDLNKLNVVVQFSKDNLSIYQLPPSLIVIRSCDRT